MLLSELRPTWRGQSNIMRRLPVVNASYGSTVNGHYHLTLRGERYASGMGFHAPMGLTYELAQPGSVVQGEEGGNQGVWCALVGLAGIGEGHALGHYQGHFRAASASAVVVVYIDGVQVHRSPVLSTQGEPWPIVVL